VAGIVGLVSPDVMQPSPEIAELCSWFATAGRDLPWRRPDAGAWGVLISEVMLQQTPVSRVLPVYLTWRERWPTPAALAAEPAGEAIRAWGRLGYPRRALRLHGAAVVITGRHAGAVPRDLGDLLALPGVGSYTARAVAAFAHGQRHAVIDTNVRRVVARWHQGRADAVSMPLRTVEGLLPPAAEDAVRAGAALMELGALVCTARRPRCDQCPLAVTCAWRRADCPAGPSTRRTQGYAGTDRQVRGAMLAALRGSADPVVRPRLLELCADPEQAARALAGLVADGLVCDAADGRLALPG
jgi:A/G-specific adenine glycosylase